MPKNVLYRGKREVRTYVHLYYSAKNLIGKAGEDAKGLTYTVMGALILIAFTFEAYLNHLGERMLEFWPEIESIRVFQKYGVLCKHFNVRPDFSRRPYQTVAKLFKFRNELAHGRTQTLEIEKLVKWEDENQKHKPKALWEDYCTLEEAKRALEDVSEVIKELHALSGFGDEPFVHGLGSFSVKAMPEKRH